MKISGYLEFIYSMTSANEFGEKLLSKYNSIVQVQHKKVFPNYNVARFYSSEHSDPLVFCHFAENIQDKVYEMTRSMAKLNSVLEVLTAEIDFISFVVNLIQIIIGRMH